MCHPRPREDLESYRGIMGVLLKNVMSLLEARTWSAAAAEVKRTNKVNVRAFGGNKEYTCAACRKQLDGKTAKACARCQYTRYCSRECQKEVRAGIAFQLHCVTTISNPIMQHPPIPGLERAQGWLQAHQRRDRAMMMSDRTLDSHTATPTAAAQLL
jgi:hypothetical protein